MNRQTRITLEIQKCRAALYILERVMEGRIDVGVVRTAILGTAAMLESAASALEDPIVFNTAMLRVLKLVRDGEPIQPARDWISVTEAHRGGLVTMTRDSSGLAKVTGLTSFGKRVAEQMLAQTKPKAARR